MQSWLPVTELAIVLATLKLLVALPAWSCWLAGMPPAGERLVLAAWTGDDKSLERLIRHGVAGDRDAAQNALIFAALTGQTRAVERLLQTDVNVNAVDHNGASALTYAASGNHGDTVRLLLEHGADPELLPARRTASHP